MFRRLSQYLKHNYYLILSSLAKVARQVSALNLTIQDCQMSQKSNRRNFLLGQLLGAKMYVRNLYKSPSRVRISATMMLFQTSQKVGRLKALLQEARQSPMNC